MVCFFVDVALESVAVGLAGVVFDLTVCNVVFFVPDVGVIVAFRSDIVGLDVDFTVLDFSEVDFTALDLEALDFALLELVEVEGLKELLVDEGIVELN